MNKKIYTILVIVLTIIEISSLFLMWKSFQNKPTTNQDELQETKEENNMFAIMLGKDGVYEESKESIWPDTSNYTFNEEKSICVNHKGELLSNVLSFDYEKLKVIIKTTSATYCSLYFDYDEKPQPFKFYVGGSTDPKYATSTSTTAYLAWEDTDIESYCLTEESTNTNCTWASVSGNSVTPSYILSTGEGEKKVYAYLKDKAGNISKYKDDTIILDTIPPTINSVTKPTNETTSITVTVNATDEGSGIQGYYYSINGGTYTTNTSNNYTFSGLTKATMYTVNVYVVDNAGLKSLVATKKLSTNICPTGTLLGTCLRNNPTEGLNSSMEGGLYRYQGEQGSVDNYVCFGTNDTDTCIGNTDAHMYRIMGINASNQVKTIKKEALNSTMQWDTDSTLNTEWPDSLIYKNINGDSFLNNTTYVPSSWNSKIATINWKYGDNTKDNTTAEELYKIENAWQDTETAKIGLMYSHDYYYAYQSGGLNCSYSGTYSTCKNSWIYISNNDTGAPTKWEWTMSRYGFMRGYNTTYTYNVWSVYSSGYVNPGNSIAGRYSVRPVFFLASNVQYISGLGIEEDPIIIN